MDNSENNFKKLLSYLKNKKIIAIIIIILVIIILACLLSYSSTNTGEVEVESSNLTLKYNNDKSAYYMEEIATGKNLGDAYINKEEYEGVFTIDLLKVNWKQTNQSDVDYAKDYCIDDLNSTINNPENYVASITIYDKDGNPVGSQLLGGDIKLDLDRNILKATVNSNHSSNITLTKNNCNNASYAIFKLNYINGGVNYTITSRISDDKFNVTHI